MVTDALHHKFYDGLQYNGTKIFYDWIREHIDPTMRVLNLGAGPPAVDPIRILKGEVAELVGADVDRCVLDNPELDRRVMIENDRIPLEDASFNLIFSDYVLEHVEKPRLFLAEVNRLLKDGGSFFFRTPNRYHYVAVISAMTPHWFHHALANRVRRNTMDAQEPWPTFYRINTRRSIAREARIAGFAGVELRMVECEPSYLRFATLPFLAGLAYERIVNSTGALAGLRSNVFGRLTK